MNKLKYKISLIGLMCLLSCFLVSSCGNGNSSESSDILKFSDDTTAAAQFVTEANEELNKIKIIYKDNEAKREDLKDATSISKIAEIQVQSGASSFKIPNCQPIARSTSDKTALPRKTDKSIGAEKSHLLFSENSCIFICRSADDSSANERSDVASVRIEVWL